MDSVRAVEISKLVAVAIDGAKQVPIDEAIEWCEIAQAEQRRHDTLGPVLDPTGYRSNARAVDATAEIAAAWLAFRKVVARTVADA